MSHKATNWAVEQRGLKPTAKIVLWHLADRHNPDLGCFPSQDRLAADCEISRSSVNVQLNTLEAAGLIRRQTRVDPKTKRQMPTRYVLAFEADFATIAEPCPETGHGAVSRKQAEPCPEIEESRVQNLDTNLVREPLREPCVALPAFERFWKAHPRPKNRDSCLEKFKAAVANGVAQIGLSVRLRGTLPRMRATSRCMSPNPITGLISGAGPTSHSQLTAGAPIFIRRKGQLCFGRT